MGRRCYRTLIATLVALLVLATFGAGLGEENQGPGISVKAEMMADGSIMLKGSTDGVEIEIEREGEAIQTFLSPEGDFFTVAFSVESGDGIAICARDDDGNENAQSFNIKLRCDSEIGEIWPDEVRSYYRTDVMKLRGWYALKDEDVEVEMALYKVDWNVVEEEDGTKKMEETLTPVGAPYIIRKTERLQDEDLELHKRLWMRQTDAEFGYSFEIQICLDDLDIQEMGQYRLLLRWYDESRDVYREIGRCEPPFIIEV